MVIAALAQAGITTPAEKKTPTLGAMTPSGTSDDVARSQDKAQ